MSGTDRVDVVIVDADTVAGWRRATPSLAQLRDAVTDLRRQNPESSVAIVGDPALKWALPDSDQQMLDVEINHQRITMAPAGSRRGHVGFIAAAVKVAERDGRRAVVVTDRAVPGCPIASLRHDGERFVADLERAEATDVVSNAPAGRRRRRGPRRG